MGGSPGEKWRACDVGEAKEGLKNELWRRWSEGKVGEWAELIVIVIAELILQPFRRFTYVTVHSPTLPLLHLRHSSFSNSSFASPTSQVLHFSPGEPPMAHGDIDGHSTVEQATTDSFTEMEEGVAPMPSTS